MPIFPYEAGMGLPPFLSQGLLDPLRAMPDHVKR